jgi:RNA polymerase sigma-70 factor (ECF subfamily)
MNHAERERLFLDLFHQNRSRIQRLCFAYLSSPADIDDLFQEIMTNLWNALPSFRGDSHPNTWLYRIAVNTALLYRRRQRPSSPLPEMEPPDLSPSTHQNLEDAERLAALRRAIATLPDQDRLIVTLLLESLSYKEIAEITGLTVNHVGVKISRIKHAIEQRMTEVSHGAV